MAPKESRGRMEIGPPRVNTLVAGPRASVMELLAGIGPQGGVLLSTAVCEEASANDGGGTLWIDLGRWAKTPSAAKAKKRGVMTAQGAASGKGLFHL